MITERKIAAFIENINSETTKKSQNMQPFRTDVQSLHGDFHLLKTLVADQNKPCQPGCSRSPMENNELKRKDVKQTGWIFPFNSYATTSVNECLCKPKAAAQLSYVSFFKTRSKLKFVFLTRNLSIKRYISAVNVQFECISFSKFLFGFEFNNDSVLFTLDGCVLPSMPQPKSGQSV